jgi:dolichol-phosphate mannosyltransferase
MDAEKFARRISPSLVESLYPTLSKLNNQVFIIAIAIALLLWQFPAALILLKRLSTGRDRHPPLVPLAVDEEQLAKQNPQVSIIIPTLNEIERLPTCLEGLRNQAAREIIIVDSRSQDGTPEYVQKMQQDFPIPLKLVTDDPLPDGWVGRPWALHNGFLSSDPQSDWILGIDADTLPQSGLVASLVKQAIADQFDILSLSPRFILKTAGEQWLQPALLMTLIFRFGATGDRNQFTEDRVMANGQCFLSRRSKLVELNGYELAKSSFCDDVTLARAAAQKGAKVGFLDGAALMQVRMYTSMMETWREWGRSLDLKDASTKDQTFLDCLLLTAVQGIPLPLCIILGLMQNRIGDLYDNDIFLTNLLTSLFWLNAFLVLIRCLLTLGIRASYTTVGIWFWLSPLADPLAVARIWLSALTKPKSWRGRTYN